MNIDLIEFAVLALLKKNKMFKESYNIIKVLNWKFGYLEVHNLLQKLQDKSLIIYSNSNGLYELTFVGEKALYENLLEGQSQLLGKSDYDKEFMVHLFNNFPADDRRDK